MSTRGRAWRRAQRARMIQRALKTEFIKSWYFRPGYEDPNISEIAARYCDRLAACSCYACGNQRHNDWQSNWEMLTLAERRAYNSYIDQMKEVSDDDC